MTDHQKCRHVSILAICAAMSVMGVQGATASATDKQSDMSVGVFVVAPGCIVSLGQDGSVTESCASASNIIRQDLSYYPAYVLESSHYHTDREINRAVVTVVY